MIGISSSANDYAWLVLLFPSAHCKCFSSRLNIRDHKQLPLFHKEHQESFHHWMKTSSLRRYLNPWPLGYDIPECIYPHPKTLSSLSLKHHPSNLTLCWCNPVFTPLSNDTLSIYLIVSCHYQSLVLSMSIWCCGWMLSVDWDPGGIRRCSDFTLSRTWQVLGCKETQVTIVINASTGQERAEGEMFDTTDGWDHWEKSLKIASKSA